MMHLSYLKHFIIVGMIITLFTAGLLGYLDYVINILDSDHLALKVGTVRFSIYTMIKTLLALTLLVWIAGIISHFGASRIKRIRSLNKSNRELMLKGFYIVLYFIIFLIGLDVVGIDLTALTVFSGAIGIGIGFGLQKITSNFISGLILLMEKSIQIDDLIELSDGTSGFIRHTNARYTLIETMDHKEVIVPNEDFIVNRVTNLTFSNTLARIEIPVGVSYQSDLKLVQRLIIEAAKEHPRCIPDPEPSCFLRNFGENSVQFILHFSVANVVDGRFGPQSDVMFSIWDKFKENGIEIPYPQRDIHIKYIADVTDTPAPEPTKKTTRSKS